MLLRNFASLMSISTTLVVSAETWREDLDWDSFKAKLSSSASLIDSDFSKYTEECLPVFRDNEYAERTNHDLIDQPSGLCLSQFFCAYERCWPRPDAANSTQSQRNEDAGDIFSTYDTLHPDVQNWLMDPQNPSLNLPSKVLFPVVASDVVAAIQFARDNGLEISVKNSGHSFIGASSKKNTLHLNMNRFTQYAPTGIVDCASQAELPITNLEDQPCTLAAARNKGAFIRVGGGENWDKVYRAVGAANNPVNKYHVVGGAAGTVSPMGWTFQGGLAGTMGGRMFGFGVDQVLQVEMVLPNGKHVKFGPIEWEDASADGFVVPKTTSVAGVCRSNPEELDESLWEWTDCSEDDGINFDDLWFAVNGGGGGTWGVVTSIYLQLHDYLTPRVFGMTVDSPITPKIKQVGDCDPQFKNVFFAFFEAFRLRWVFAPSTLDVSQAESDACGFADAFQPALVCYGDEPYQTLVEKWEFYANSFYDPSVFYNVTLDYAMTCIGTVENSWAEFMEYSDGQYAGQIADTPNPTIPSVAEQSEVLNVLMPKKYVEENFEAIVNAPGTVYSSPSWYLAFGSGTASASDQANSLGEAHRQAAFKVISPAADFYASTFGALFDTSDKTNFPSFQGSNHVGNNYMGPLKDDWTKACPAEWTQEERNEKCVSIQETLWGTKTLARLEAIKEDIDPNYIFDCNGCIGNNRKKQSEPPVTSAPVTLAPVTSAPVSSAPVSSAPVTPAPIEPSDETSGSAGKESFCLFALTFVGLVNFLLL